MTDPADPLAQFSNALAARAEAAKSAVVAIRLAHGRHLTGMAWRPDAIVASEQSLPQKDEFEIVTAGGSTLTAKLAGRDPSTNIAVLRPAAPIAETEESAHGTRNSTLVARCSHSHHFTVGDVLTSLRARATVQAGKLRRAQRLAQIEALTLRAGKLLQARQLLA